MDFANFLNMAGKDIKKKEQKDLEKSNGLISELADDRNIVLWIGYKNIQSNKKLVWATWFLAITTIILSVLTIIFK
ncbi:MAG: hypothetical protein KJ949_02245 [Nanoarchaeota archaeon]|nr:hypothetical protein [Nanoarchaeota archaeon]MBU4308560.1 hypothetical protein [Nanoarchaeota archaeon]